MADERMDRIEMNLERLEADITRLEQLQDAHDKRIQRLTEFQAVLMESQNDTWKALKTMSDNLDKLIRMRGTNGH